MPLMFITYMLQYLDKVTLGYTAVMGIQKDAVSLVSAIAATSNSALAFSGPAVFLD
jgi:hypothetical protein